MEIKFYSFKKMFFSYLFCFIPFCLLGGLLSLFNVFPIYFNQTPYYGVTGLILSILLIPFFSVIFCSLNWLVLNAGYFLYSIFVKFVQTKR